MIYRIKSNRVRRTYQGGSRIDAFTGECAPKIEDALYPEDWTASMTTTGADDEGIGQTEEGLSLRQIIGCDDYPILVKLLDADERLVVQAHPTVEFAKEHCSSNHGKTECWYFLDCDPDAYIYIGFKNGITRDMWQDIIRRQDIGKMLDIMHRIPVHKGDLSLLTAVFLTL